MKARIGVADRTLLKVGIEDGYQQGIATVLYVLSMSCGWRKKRLNRVLREIESLLSIRFGGHKVLIQDMSRKLKEDYGIDVKDIKIDISVKMK